MIRLVCFLVLWVPLTLKAQFTYQLDQSIPVEYVKGEVLSMPWAGGLNAAQFNTMDLDADGTDDLVLFDRMANKVITFLARDNDYVPAPEYETLFPEEITNWLLLRDYNCDGRKDIFTGDILGIKVYRNVSSGSLPEWEQHLFDDGYGGQSTVLLTEGATTKINLQLQFDDLPSISDVDGDGDLDIMNVQYAGNSVEFHQNLAVENGLPCGSLEFKRMTRAWGGFTDCGCGQFAYNGEDCVPNGGGRTKHAGGKSLLVMDFNGDQQQDVLFSESECTLLYALPNEGTTADPVFTRAFAFPQGNPVSFVIFPAAFYEDVDFDGKKDLIATPNIFAREFLNTNLQHSTWFYKNTGTTASPAFTLVRQNFLQNKMIDVGDNAVPALIDMDGDGDLDMLISNHSSLQYASTIHLYENIGSPAAPSFRLLTDDYLLFSTSRLYNMKVQFADVDNDGTTDLAFTATSFDDGLTNLYYISNKSTSAVSFEGSTLTRLEFPLTSTENLHITDIDGDGFSDILAGRSEGNLEYWRNTGTSGAPAYVLDEENFLGYDNSTLRQNLSCTTGDLDANGSLDLIVGDQTGRAEVISDFQQQLGGPVEPDRNLIFSPLTETYVDQNLGGRIWPTVANLFNTNKPAVVVGNILGGIRILKHDEGTSIPGEPQLEVYPNPVAESEVLNLQADRSGTLEVVSVLGQRIGTPMVMRANRLHKVTLTGLAAGMYVLKFSAGNRSVTRRVIIQ